MTDQSQPRRQSIATRKGDDGTTSLLYGQRVAKNHPQVEAVGALDELNAALGVAKATRMGGTDAGAIDLIQRDLVALMGEVSCAESDAGRYAESKFAKIGDEELARIDRELDAIEALQPRFDGWATPGANLHAAALDVARTAARRAERQLVALPGHGRAVRPILLQYVNRVSDLLWLLARQAES